MSASWDGAVCFAEADGKPGHYYVTARREDGRTALLVGPFTQRTPGQNAHAQALGYVRAARRLVNEVNPRKAPWLVYGTSRIDRRGCPPAGKLNVQILPHSAQKEKVTA